MQLTYRGHTYEVSSPRINPMEIHDTATFLGKRYTRQQFSRPHRQHPSEELRYRGVPYSR